MEYGILALQIFCMVFFGKFYIQVFFFADVHADHLLFKAGNKSVRADFKALPLGSAAREGNAVHRARIVQVQGIAHLHSASFNVLHGGFLFHIMLNAVVDFFLCHGMHIFGDLQTLVLTKSHIGLYIDLNGEF